MTNRTEEQSEELAGLLTRLGNRSARWQVIAEDTFAEVQRLQIKVRELENKS